MAKCFRNIKYILFISLHLFTKILSKYETKKCRNDFIHFCLRHWINFFRYSKSVDLKWISGELLVNKNSRSQSVLFNAFRPFKKIKICKPGFHKCYQLLLEENVRRSFSIDERHECPMEPDLVNKSASSEHKLQFPTSSAISTWNFYQGISLYFPHFNFSILSLNNQCSLMLWSGLLIILFKLNLN